MLSRGKEDVGHAVVGSPAFKLLRYGSAPTIVGDRAAGSGLGEEDREKQARRGEKARRGAWVLVGGGDIPTFAHDPRPRGHAG